MSENTGKNPKPAFDVQVPKPSAKEEVESAKILFQEGLLDEAKRTLHRILISSPNYSSAKRLLDEIRDAELDQILNRNSSASSRRRKPEDPERLIQNLEAHLGIQPLEGAMDPASENWKPAPDLSHQEHFDLAIAFFEMECHRDAIRELSEALRKLRLERTTLDDLGIGIVALKAEALILLGEAFEAKSFLAPILIEPEISHEAKLPLYYLAGRAEELLRSNREARAWMEKVLEIDPLFRDANFRIRML